MDTSGLPARLVSFLVAGKKGEDDMKIFQYLRRKGVCAPFLTKIFNKRLNDYHWGLVVGSYVKDSKVNFIPLSCLEFDKDDYSFCDKILDIYKLVKYGNVYILERKKEHEEDKEALLVINSPINYYEVLENNSNVKTIMYSDVNIGKREITGAGYCVILHLKGNCKIKFKPIDGSRVIYLQYDEVSKELKETW